MAQKLSSCHCWRHSSASRRPNQLPRPPRVPPPPRLLANHGHSKGSDHRMVNWEPEWVAVGQDLGLMTFRLNGDETNLNVRHKTLAGGNQADQGKVLLSSPRCCCHCLPQQMPALRPHFLVLASPLPTEAWRQDWALIAALWLPLCLPLRKGQHWDRDRAAPSPTASAEGAAPLDRLMPLALSPRSHRGCWHSDLAVSVALSRRTSGGDLPANLPWRLPRLAPALIGSPNPDQGPFDGDTVPSSRKEGYQFQPERTLRNVSLIRGHLAPKGSYNSALQRTSERGDD
ncbi:hypothetical protein QTO34_015858 [Cnephaeus nilssonii]|uniref:Uncharacterized protein n=1 Tax=Cnephaeus nilssonii TaxID=3371016 RepID=A0AA40I5M9_CNENI|nr:hypothetical protein QTO34_015858 [Eptesicus nilssonii]